MILLDKPFVSDFLKATIKENDLQVIKTEASKDLDLGNGITLLSEEEAIQKIKHEKNVCLYSTSENAIGWIAKHLPFTNIPQNIALFKDKAAFRNLIQPMFPDFYFKEIKLAELDELSVENIPLPFIIKPSIGFFSMGVYKVSNLQTWKETKLAISEEILGVQGLYPEEVLNTKSFIIEECIEGEEFAFDGYFNAEGKPVIFSIYKHLFSSDGDVSDRVYITSKEIIESNIDQFTKFLEEIGRLSKVKNFPIHVEVRRDATGSVIPIEINPMRFGGWCTTADMTYLAYQFNPYLYYLNQIEPNWTEILKDKAGKIYSIIVLDNSTGIEGNQISNFDFDRLVSNFEKPLELRKIDYKEYPVFGFLFTETKADDITELENILVSDLKEFITEQKFNSTSTLSI